MLPSGTEIILKRELEETLFHVVVTLPVPDLSNDWNLGKAIIRGRRGRKSRGRRWSRTECQSVSASRVSRCTDRCRMTDLQ